MILIDIDALNVNINKLKFYLKEEQLAIDSLANFHNNGYNSFYSHIFLIASVLFMPQGVYRVKVCRVFGGQIAEQYSYRHRNAECDSYRRKRWHGFEPHQRAEHHREDRPDYNTDDPADAADRARLYNELGFDVTVLGAK